MKYYGMENLKQYYKKDIKVIDNKNNAIIGFFGMYVKEGDNEPDSESIVLELNNGELKEIFTPDIISIKIV